MASKKELTVSEGRVYPGKDTPEIFVDGFQGIQLFNGVFRINFYRTFYPPDKDTDENRKVVLTLLASGSSLLAVHEVLGDILDKAKADGILEVFAASDPDSTDG